MTQVRRDFHGITIPSHQKWIFDSSVYPVTLNEWIRSKCDCHHHLFLLDCQMIRSFIHHHKYDRVFLKGRTQILFFKRKRKPELYRISLPMKWRCVIAHWQCQASFFFFFRVVQYEERDYRDGATTAAQCTDVKYILDKETLRERYTHNARAADSVRLTCGQNESPSVDVHTHVPDFSLQLPTNP